MTFLKRVDLLADSICGVAVSSSPRTGFSSSIDFALVIGTPPTMIAYSSGLFRASEIFRAGILLDLLGLLLLVTAVTGVWRLFGLV